MTKLEYNNEPELTVELTIICTKSPSWGPCYGASGKPKATKFTWKSTQKSAEAISAPARYPPKSSSKGSIGQQ
jgi:hypothetical protein